MTSPAPPEAAYRIERIMSASPDRVYRAWIDPEWVRRWMTPGELIIDHVKVDARVGGKIKIRHSLKGQDVGGYEGEFLKLIPGRELVYRWAFVGTEPEKGEYYDSLVTVTLRPAPRGKTHMTIVHEKLEALRRGAPELASQVSWGWNSCLDKLASVLSEGSNKEGN